MPDEKMTFEDIERDVTGEIKAAEEHTDQINADRKKTWNAYYGKKLGNEVKGRSQFITKETMDVIEWMMPYFIRTFAAGDPKVEIEIQGQEPWIGGALMDKIQDDLSSASPNLFIIFYQWFKDALVSDTAFVKLDWDLDQTKVNVDFEELPIDLMQQLVSDPDVTITDGGQMEFRDGGIVFVNVKTEIVKTLKDTIYVENTPYWEFIEDSKARDINDQHGKGHKTEVTLDYIKRVNRARTEGKKQYFKNIDKLESRESKGRYTTYVEDDNENEYSDTDKGAKAPVKLVEWFTRLDVDGDGYLEDIICHVGNGHLLRWEEVEDGFIPFSLIKPIIDCYKFTGTSYASLVVEIQNLKTMLLRRILDNFDFQNSGRWLRDPNSGIDAFTLMQNIPGSVITGKVDGLKNITPEAFNPSSLSILEYVSTLKEERTGITRYNQGMDANSLNDTARGIMQIQTAAMQRMELVGRLFAETGLKDFYRKCVLLYQKHLKRPFVAKVHGEDIEVQPQMIQGKVITRVNMGVTASVGVEEAGKLEKLLNVLFGINERFPGLLTPEKIHNLSSRYISLLGFKPVDDFIGSLKEYTEQVQQSSQQQQEMQNQLMQFEQKLKEMEMQIKGREVDIKEKKVIQDGVIEREKIAMDERDSIRDFHVGRMK
jgi:hypothetical protein